MTLLPSVVLNFKVLSLAGTLLLYCVCCQKVQSAPVTDSHYNRFGFATHLALAKDTYLNENYSRQAIPVQDHAKPLILNVGVDLRKILAVEEHEQRINVSLWIREYWIDEYITWDPKEYEGLNRIRVEHGTIWNPDLVLYTNGGEDQEILKHINVIVHHTGHVTYTYPALYSVACHMDIQ